ncbi:Uncharacterized protein BM_BM17542 [Brugia malayi]|uniref:Uncharacterized protein n=1 Tax=Brugia malayi TaxID=6279 RepID=A0A4E9FPZ2_BRUMA|nr:Uncharacterized protein BM_BM17542 [Brugia malayi]VIO94753.1 Uncharacterized protein BM_BM17542 [Brugia malayi]
MELIVKKLYFTKTPTAHVHRTEPVQIRESTSIEHKEVKTEPVQIRESTSIEHKEVKTEPVQIRESTSIEHKEVKTEPVQIRDLPVSSTKKSKRNQYKFEIYQYRAQRGQRSEPSRKEATLYHKEIGQ